MNTRIQAVIDDCPDNLWFSESRLGARQLVYLDSTLVRDYGLHSIQSYVDPNKHGCKQLLMIALCMNYTRLYTCRQPVVL